MSTAAAASNWGDSGPEPGEREEGGRKEGRREEGRKEGGKGGREGGKRGYIWRWLSRSEVH